MLWHRYVVSEVGDLSADASDEDLLVLSVGQPEAFAVFYDRFALRLLAHFARRTFDAEAAADLTAETFAQAFASRDRFRAHAPGGAAAWLFTIAKRQLARYYRRRRVEMQYSRRLGIPPPQLSSDDHDRIERLIDFEAVGRAIGGALSKLSSDQRDAVVLRVIDALSYAEIARTMSCSEAVARARVSRGLHRLRDLLEPITGDLR
jgi:RNA polymerase sigma factor (sigma-70 family)